MEEAYHLDPEDIFREFNVDPKVGLDEQIVHQCRARFGTNELPRAEAVPLWKLVLKQFEDLLVKILLGAAVVSFFLALFEDAEDRLTAFMEPVVIGLILVANAIVGVVQETNAEKAIEALKEFTPEKATVLRGGRLSDIPASELVPGDIIEVRVGNRVPADARIMQIFSALLRAEHSALTGESNTVLRVEEAVPRQESRVVIQDQKCMLFMGTTVTLGHARAVVTNTGLNTEFGKIHKGVQKHDEKDSPLEKTLNEFGKLLSWIILVICVLVWLVNIRNFNDASHGGWVRGAVYYFKIAVALAVAAIPEGLPAVVTTCLALGAVKMAKRHAIVRSLPHVETLGCTTVICSDKTGTLTTNQMSVSKVLVADSMHSGAGADHSMPVLQEFDVSGTTFSGLDGYISSHGMKVSSPAQVRNLRDIAMVGCLCNDAHLVYHPATDSTGKVGEATEAALLTLCEKIGVLPSVSPNVRETLKVEAKLQIHCNVWKEQWEKLATLDFARDRKSMSVLVRSRNDSGGPTSLLVKGAPESIMDRCTGIQMNDGNVIPFTGRIRSALEERVNGFSEDAALRCLAFAKKENAPLLKEIHGINDSDFVRVESNLIFLGVCGMIDPPREGVREALQTCRTAGIRVIGVTGDHQATAEAIGREIGLISELDGTHGKSITGLEFEKLGFEEQRQVARTASLFSRVEPSHKASLVQILQREGEVVAMTGDGVNDAPALHSADIGIAMGTGTEVAKNSSAIILSDDNFATIVAAIEEGRGIYNNTKQFIRYLISSNIGEVVCIFLTAVFGMPEALVPVQLLWVNFVTDGLPATALGFNKKDADIMKHPPRSPKEPIVNGWMFVRYLIVGLYVGFATVGGFAYWFLWFSGGPHLSWHELTNFHACADLGVDCAIFNSRIPSTIALSILVSVEMFNACNAVSENQSLLSMPLWTNMWLVGAISLSFALHLLLLYVPFLARIFSAAPLGFSEWGIVLGISLPVILIDEILKLITRLSWTVRRPRRAVSTSRSGDEDGKEL